MLVIGNGESRQNLNISKINKIKIGCNAIYRDFKVDHLVCVDKKMLSEVTTHCVDTLIYTRKDWIDKYKHLSNVKLIPDLPYQGMLRMDEDWHWGSGPYAVLLASTLTKQPIHLIGFDLYSNNGQLNNIYKNTPNYGNESKRAVDPSYWIYQISKIFEIFNETKYIIHNSKTWKMPKNWLKSNVYLDTDTIDMYYK